MPLRTIRTQCQVLVLNVLNIGSYVMYLATPPEVRRFRGDAVTVVPQVLS